MSKISFFAKEEIECPVCNFRFKREELLTGRSRLISGALKIDLKREYIPNDSYGKVYPRIYSVTTCPECYYSALNTHFFLVKNNERIKSALTNEIKNRKKVDAIFNNTLDFNNFKTLKEGAAGYILSIMCYEHFDKNYNPTFNSAKCTLRAAWTFGDLHSEFPDENYDYLEKIFYYKAAYLYNLVIEKEQNGSEAINTEYAIFGPDTDKNYGYGSVLYLAGLLEYYYGNKDNKDYRKNRLNEIKAVLSKIVGMGKSSRAKPSVLLDKIKEVYFRIAEEVKTLN